MLKRALDKCSSFMLGVASLLRQNTNIKNNKLEMAALTPSGVSLLNELPDKVRHSGIYYILQLIDIKIFEHSLQNNVKAK